MSRAMRIACGTVVLLTGLMLGQGTGAGGGGGTGGGWGATTCECSGGTGGTLSECGQCSGTIKLKLGCALCCDDSSGTAFCDQKDGEGIHT